MDSHVVSSPGARSLYTWTNDNPMHEKTDKWWLPSRISFFNSQVGFLSITPSSDGWGRLNYIVLRTELSIQMTKEWMDVILFTQTKVNGCDPLYLGKFGLGAPRGRSKFHQPWETSHPTPTWNQKATTEHRIINVPLVGFKILVASQTVKRFGFLFLLLCVLLVGKR